MLALTLNQPMACIYLVKVIYCLLLDIESFFFYLLIILPIPKTNSLQFSKIAVK